ncbi:protein kinase domain-containing protein [Ferrimonas balearica]|uniref:protein kinase domain-containing protein n=1 Tax=Ferrimonas balearica TaxID=44012 RepID=UPI001C560303|nr:protein kinase [Ferrimonas balearica]MBW3165697.1 protein kinase [Ferrimonas balearica]MBY6107875.1 protein kinase [Ferrimonas balearica]MBY6225216.1 protein kinase [Ferrimonas balearica]
MGSAKPLQQFYISEEQSIYLLREEDARKHRQWVSLCQQQLRRLGYQQVHFIGKGVFGFVFAGRLGNTEQVFKFSRRTLPARLQARLQEEAEILAPLDHPHIPALVRHVTASGQGILQMERAPGVDLAHFAQRCGPLPVTYLVPIAAQLADILTYLRGLPRPVVHGDIKPSNLVFDHRHKHLSLVDWGSAVLAQRDAYDHPLGSALGRVDGDHDSNARMGDVFFIGPEQLAGAPSSPRFDEQGAAATLYALASGQISRFGSKLLPAASLGLPRPLAEILDAMLSDDPNLRREGGDHFIKTLPASRHWLLLPLPAPAPSPQLPVWTHHQGKAVETVAYSSRKSFLREHQIEPLPPEREADLQLAHYYRDFMVGMGDNEKGFVAAVGQLGHYPLLGGLALHWTDTGLHIDSSLNLQDPTLKTPFIRAVNNMVALARGIRPAPQADGKAVFKACFFNARDTLHLERNQRQARFVAPPELALPFEISDAPELEDKTRLHSYFEDGQDPDENLTLPASIMAELGRLNLIHHTGCIIFEVLEDHLKIHSYLRLLNPRKADEFRACLARILDAVGDIDDLGIAGFMKLPYKNTRQFQPHGGAEPRYYPRDPRRPA